MNTTSFFEQYYNHAEVNSIMIMNDQGIIMDANRSFCINFNYAKEDLVGRHFEMLFNQADRERRKPGKELETVLSRGQAHDENYILNKEGREVWCTGESIRIRCDGEIFIVKDIINLHSKKELQLFLTDTEEILERVFAVSREIPMMVLSWNLKVQRVNQAFLDLFNMEQFPAENSRLSELDNPFWQTEDVRQTLLDLLVTDSAMKEKKFKLATGAENHDICISSKIINSNHNNGRRIFLIFN